MTTAQEMAEQKRLAKERAKQQKQMVRLQTRYGLIMFSIQQLNMVAKVLVVYLK